MNFVEHWLELFHARAAAVDAAMDEMNIWAPQIFEDEVLRGLPRAAAREARWRAELLVEESNASLEAMAELAAGIRDSAMFAEQIRHECARAITQVWRLRGDGHAEQEAGCCVAGDLIATIVAGMAAATGEMDRWARRELDQTGWLIFGGLRRVRQAKREERCADRTWHMWLEDEADWWLVLGP